MITTMVIVLLTATFILLLIDARDGQPHEPREQPRA